MAKKKPAKKKLSPFQLLGMRAEPPKYTISTKVRAIIDDPSLDSEGLSPKDRAILVYELGSRLVGDEHADFHDHYLRHANSLVAIGKKGYEWVYSVLAEEVDEDTSGNGDNWFPLLPFMLARERDTVEDAAKLICIHHPGDGKSSLVGPADVLTSMLNRKPELEASEGAARKQVAEAIAGGMSVVLFCGDLRLLDMLNQAWDSSPDEVRELLYQFFDERITELQVEFYLSILERNKPDSDDFERAALHLSHCVQPHCMPYPREKVTVDRVFFNFGLNKNGDELQVKAQTPVRKYLAKIAPRLRALEPRAPKLIASILDSWQKAA